MPPPPPPFHPLCLPPPPPMPLTPSGLRRIDPKPDGGAIRKTHFTLRTSTSTPMQRCHDHGGARRGRGEREGGTFVGCAGWMVRRGDISSLPTASREEEATIVGRLVGQGWGLKGLFQ